MTAAGRKRNSRRISERKETMKLYTKQGDQGNTTLGGGIHVSKTDIRIELLGTIDELNSQIGVAKVLTEGTLHSDLERIQKTLIRLMTGIAFPQERKYRFSADETERLEKRIDEMEASFARRHEFALFGGCEVSARLDLARAVARRAERRFWEASRLYPQDRSALQYMNRLADFLYISARWTDANRSTGPRENVRQEVIREILKNS